VFNIDRDPEALNRFYPELGKTLGEELLQVHRCYYPQLKPALPIVKAIAHITGGGFVGNIPRILPEGVAAHLEKRLWQVPSVFKLIQKEGNIAESEMYRVFNMGIGMAIVCAPQEAARLGGILPEARVIGGIVKREGEARVILR
jgi:phosphoribosylformylglycinamidine cyclo-ligase